MGTMKPHHQAAADLACQRLIQTVEGLCGVFVVGSIATGQERDDSDVDLAVVVDDVAYQQRFTDEQTAFIWTDVCDYPRGYVEGQFHSLSYLEKAGRDASEPTRYGFLGAFALHCPDPELESLVAKIPVYPEADVEHRLVSFMAQVQLNRHFFWSEAKKRSDPLLLSHAATQIVFFGCRMLLAHHRVLFACNKRLHEQTLALPDLPQGFDAMIADVLTQRSDEAKEAFCKAIEEAASWPEASWETLLGRFRQDAELGWYSKTHDVSQW